MYERDGIAANIVEMSCAGKTIKEITERFGISPGTMKDYVRKMRLGRALPYEKSQYPIRKAEILANLEKWRAYCERKAALEAEFRASLVYFD